MSRTHSLRAALFAGCSLSFAFIAQPALAQHEGEEGQDPNILVTGHAAGAVFDREALERGQAGSSDTAELLSQLPGVDAATGGGFSSMPVIRGLSQQRISILVDGQLIDLSCPNDMNTPLSYTDPQTVASVQVLAGVSPVSLGGDNIGGIVAVSSAPPRFGDGTAITLSGSASAFYRSNGDGFGGSLSLTAANASFSATYSGSYTQSDQYHGGGGDGLVRSTEYAKTDHALALAYRDGMALVQLRGGFQFSPYEGFVNQAMDMVSNKSWFVNGSFEDSFDWGSVELTAAYRDTDHVMNFLEDKLPGAMPMNTEVHSFDMAGKTELPLSMHDTLRLGAEYHHQWLDDYWPPVAGSMMMGPNMFVNINGGTRNRAGAHVEWERHWSSALTTTAGLRYDRVAMNTGDVAPYGTSMMQLADVQAAAAFNAADRQRTDNNVSYSLLASWRVSDMATLEAGFAHKVRSPNLYERYAWGRGAMASRMIGWYGDGNGYVGNLDLLPEKADTLSLALNLGGGAYGWSLDIAPHYTRVDDYIDGQFLQVLTNMMGMPTPFVQLQFANQDAEFYGVDVAGTVELFHGEGGNGTSLALAPSWLRGDNLTDGGPLYRQMPFNARASLVHHQGALELSAGLEWVAEKTRVDATRNEPVTDDYALVNIGVAYDAGPVRFSLTANNLFDSAYALPLGGVSLGDYKATGVLRPVPGRGRSIDFGISTRF